MFYGILIRMHWNEHNPPHFHALYQNYAAAFNFDGELIEGEFPKNQQKLVSAWTLLHKDELEANWELARNKETLFNINPLQ